MTWHTGLRLMRYKTVENVLSEWQEIERDVATEIMGYYKYEAPYGEGYVCNGPADRWESCPKYMNNIYKALSVARKVMGDSQGTIIDISLSLNPFHKYRKDEDDDSWLYSFRFHFRNACYIAFESTHACSAICELSLFIKREVFSKEGWPGIIQEVSGSREEKLLSYEEAVELFRRVD
jgi:hypothetical protein